MFSAIVSAAIKVPVHGYLHIIATESVGVLEIGDKLTDGNEYYDVTAIPIITRRDNHSRKKGAIEFCISATENDLIGKKLSTEKRDEDYSFQPRSLEKISKTTQHK